MAETISPVIVRGVVKATASEACRCNDCGMFVGWAYRVGSLGLQLTCAECMSERFEALNA